MKALEIARSDDLNGLREMSVLNKLGGQGRSPRLSEILFERSSRSFGSLAALPSNVEAIESGLLFAAGLNTHVAVTGPCGWGKTHLLEAVTYRVTHELGSPVERVSAMDLVSNLSKGDSTTPLVVDDVHEVLGKPRPQLALRLHLERRVRAGRPTMLAFTMPKANRQLKSFLPSFRDWTLSSMGEPQPEERVLLLNHLCQAEGLSLSQALVKIIAHGMHGNGSTLSGALKRLRLTNNSWLDTRSTIRACGVLDPFFADNPEWDLKLKILKVAETHRMAFPRASVADLALVTMLHEAGIGEADVARCMGISPSEAYLRAARFQQKAAADPTICLYVRQLVDLVVDSLQ